MLTVYCAFRREQVSISSLYARLGFTFDIHSSISRLSPSKLHNLVAYVKGEGDVDGKKLASALEHLNENDGDWEYNDGCVNCDEEYFSPPLGVQEEITLSCTDGVLVRHKGLMCAHFQYIADFISEYPGKDVPIPFSVDQLNRALGILEERSARLDVCSDVVEFLNPIHGTYPLAFVLTGVPVERLKTIASRLTLSERLTLRYLSSFSETVPLPKGGEGHYILAACPSVCEDELAFELFSDCPSWLLYHYGDTLLYKRENPLTSATYSLIQKAEFHLDYDEVPSKYTEEYMRMVLNRALEHHYTNNWERASRILALMGRRNEALGNKNLLLSPPYCIDGKTPVSDEGMAVVRKLYPGQWSDKLLQY